MSRLAERLVRDRADLIDRDWRSSCDVSDAVDGNAVVERVADALGRCAGNARPGHAHDGLDELFEGPALRDLQPADITCLREVIRRQVLIDLSLQDAVAASHCVSTVLDDLHDRVAHLLLADAEALARTDPLTQLGNRRAADDALATAVATSVRHGRPLVVLSIDVDHLKAVNDDIGHEAGDEVLLSLANAFREGLRAGDRAFRVGGDEFVVVLPETAMDTAPVVLDRVRAAGAPPFSVGMASAPDEATEPSALLGLADHRLIEGRRLERAPMPAAAHRARWPRVVALAVLLTLVLLPAVAAGYRAWVDDNAALALGAMVLVAAAVAAGSGLSYRTSGRAPLARAVLVPLSAMVVANVAVVSANIGDLPERAPTPMSQGSPSEPTAAPRPAPDLPIEVDAFGSDTGAVPGGSSSSASTGAPQSVEIGRPTTTTAAPSGSTTTGSPASAPLQPGASNPSQTPPTGSSTPPPSSQQRPPTAAPAVEAHDDHAVLDGRRAAVPVLDNDAAEGGELDRKSVEIVTAPSSGKATVRGDGQVVYLAQREGSDDRFRYRVCDTSGRCAEAWVVIAASDR